MDIDWKKMTLGNIITILMAGFALAYGYGVLGANQQTINEKITKLETRLEANSKVETSVIRLEEKTNYIIEQVGTLTRKLDDAANNTSPPPR